MKKNSRWESLVKKLFVQFQFFYEYLGPSSAGRKYLGIAQKSGAKNLDGSKIFLPPADPFGEKNDVHFQLYFADGSKRTTYKWADGCNGDMHLSGIEPTDFFRFLPVAEFAPLIFPTNRNFYEESVNGTFLSDKTFDKRPKYPIYHVLHKKVFSAKYFTEALNIPGGLLSIKFAIPKSADPNRALIAVRSLNFSLALFYAVCLLESAYLDLFGQDRAAEQQIAFLENNWRLGQGKIAQRMNSCHLYILQLLIKLTHVSGYGITAALFRLKNGAHSFNPGHGTWHIGCGGQHIPYKLFLQEQIKYLVEEWCRQILAEKSVAASKELANQINLAVKLGELFGIGYQVDQKIGKDYYFNQPVDFRPGFAQGAAFNAINFTAQCNLESPLWRVYYLYSRKMWKHSQENLSIFAGEGAAWEAEKNHPRAVLFNIIHEYKIKFMLDKLKESKKKLLASINQARGNFILSTLGQDK